MLEKLELFRTLELIFLNDVWTYEAKRCKDLKSVFQLEREHALEDLGHKKSNVFYV